MRMASVLAAGGFSIEAVAPAQEALEAGLAAAKTLKEVGRPSATEADIALLRRLRDSSTDTEEAAESALQSVQKFLETTAEALDKALLA